MWKLVPIVIVALVFAMLAEKSSVTANGPLGEKKYIRKDVFWTVLTVIVLATFCGLRIKYDDTGGYRRGYEGINAGLGWELYKRIDWTWGKYPGFNVMNVTFKLLGVSTQSYFMITSFFTIGIYIWFIRKYTENIWLPIFLFITSGCYTFAFAGLKQVLAVAFCTLGIDRAIRKKWSAFVFWVAVGSTFHPYTILFLVTPFLAFTPWEKKTYLLLALCMVIAMAFQPFLESVEDISETVGKGYSVEALSSGEGVSIFRVLVAWAPVAVSFVVRKHMEHRWGRAECIMMNLTMLHAGLMFIALFGNPIYFGRLANYFLVYPIVCLPFLLKFYQKKSRQLLLFLLVVGYVGYMYCNNAVARPFDAYQGMNFFDYLFNGM